MRVRISDHALVWIQNDLRHRILEIMAACSEEPDAVLYSQILEAIGIKLSDVDDTTKRHSLMAAIPKLRNLGALNPVYDALDLWIFRWILLPKGTFQLTGETLLQEAHTVLQARYRGRKRPKGKMRAATIISVAEQRVLDMKETMQRRGFETHHEMYRTLMCEAAQILSDNDAERAISESEASSCCHKV